MIQNPVAFIGQSILGSTSGSVLFVGSNGDLQPDNTNFFWDNTDKYFGLGGSPTARLHVRGTTTNHVGRFDIGIDMARVTPPPQPTLTLINSAGNINPGTHYYYVSYITAVGETSLSNVTASAPSIVTDASNAQVQVTIPVSSDYRVTGRKIYRSVTGSIYWNDVKCVGTVNNNTATTFIDNVADVNRTGPASLSRDNTTNRIITIDNTATMLIGNNTVLGFNAGATTIAGTAGSGDNTLIGKDAGKAFTDATRVTAVGNYAAGQMTAFGSCTIIGDNAAGISSHFYAGVAVGRNSGGWVGQGYDNVFVGGWAGFGATPYYTTNRNVGIGNSCLYRLNTGSADNIGIGYFSGENISTGTFNIVIGSRSNPTTTTGSYNIVLGAYVGLPSATASGQLNIGNVLYGTGLYQTASASSSPTSNGLIGIGIAPTGASRLELAAGTTSYAPLKLTSGTNLTSPVAGTFEYDGTNFYLSPSTTRKRIPLTNDATPSNGQIPIGNGTDYTVAAITAGTGISVTNGSGTITIANTSTGLTWTEVTGTSQSAAVNNGYVANNAALVTITLPSTAAVGDIVRIGGKGAGLWKLGQNSGQTVHFGNVDSTTGTGGSISAISRYDAIEVVCITADTDWVVLSSVGNFTIV